MIYFVLGVAIVVGGGIIALALFVKPTQEDYDRYGPSYMTTRRGRRR